MGERVDAIPEPSAGEIPLGRAACLTSAAWRARIEKRRWIDERRKAWRSPGMSKVGNQPRRTGFFAWQIAFPGDLPQSFCFPPPKGEFPGRRPPGGALLLRLPLTGGRWLGKFSQGEAWRGLPLRKRRPLQGLSLRPIPPPGGRWPGKFSEEGGLEGGRLFQEVPFLQGLPLRN